MVGHSSPVAISTLPHVASRTSAATTQILGSGYIRERALGFTSCHLTGSSIHCTVIKSFASKDTEQLHKRESVRRFKSIERVALRKLRQLDAATQLRDLAAPPGNHLEPLRGDRKGQHSIRVNDQWRICFIWRDGDAHAVEITDYH
jgi:proteic killer suppression protein